jgi:hypothetical protein
MFGIYRRSSYAWNSISIALGRKKQAVYAEEYCFLSSDCDAVSISDCTGCRICMECGGDESSVYIRLSKRLEFLENQLRYTHILLVGVKNFCPYFPYFLTDLRDIRHIIRPCSAVEQFHVS